MFRVYIKVFLLACGMFGCVFSTGVSAEQYFEEGKHYLRVPEHIRGHEDIVRLMASEPKKIQVLMFFSYGCYWCSQVNRPFDNWAANYPEEVSVYRYAVVFNRMWKELAKLYYLVESLDSSGKLDDEIFDAIHKNQVRIWEPKVRDKFFVKRGFDEEVIKKLFNSFSIERKVKRADDLMNAYEITATPNIIINGPLTSYMTNLTMTNTAKDLFNVVDFLVKQEQSYFENVG